MSPSASGLSRLSAARLSALQHDPARSRSRSAARLAAVQALYQQEMEGTPVPRLLQANSTSTGSARRSRTRNITTPSATSSTTSSSGVDARRREIDELIAGELAEGWSLERLDRPMRAILRAGTYELLARADVPVGSVISEYVDVAHAFYDKRESGFVNGLLDASGEAGAAGAGVKSMREVAGIQRAAADRDRALPRCGLLDDVALLDGLVLTHDSIAEGVHFLPSDPRQASAGSWSR